MTKRRWTAENTEDDLRELNDAQEHLEARAPKLDPQTIADALNNSFFEGADARQLERNAARFLGLN